MVSNCDSYPLQLLPSSSTTTLKNPFETASILSNATSSRFSRTSNATLRAPPPYTPFQATSCLQVQSSGHSLLAFPTPPKALTTPVFTLSPDGRCERPLYLSIRSTRKSGSCDLVRADDDAAASIVHTRYKMGPSCDPIVWLESGSHSGRELTMESKWMSRATMFTFGNKRYEWRYGNKAEKRRVEVERGEECYCLLLLERINGEGKEAPRTLLARFVRGEETRTAGTAKCHSGNGGRLEMVLERDRENLVTGNAELISLDDGRVDESGIEEALVVATVIVMLKKEIDRMRGWQIAVIANTKGAMLPFYAIQHMRQRHAEPPAF